MKNTSIRASKVLLVALALGLSSLAGHASAQALNGGSGDGSYSTGNGCSISSFTADPDTIASGQSATLDWTTYGCMNTTLNGGSFTGQLEPMTGSISTGPLDGTTTFTLSANGSNGSTTAQATVSVSNSQYAYSDSCGNQAENEDPTCGSDYQQDFITTAATNVGSTTARLNGIALDTPDSFSAYFEYGTTPNLGQATIFQDLGNVNVYYVHQDLNTLPSTTYYYRMDAQIVGGATVYGQIFSFTTAPAAAAPSYVADTGDTSTNGSGQSTTNTASDSGSVQSATATASPASSIDAVQVTVSDKQDAIQIGDTVEYTVDYANGTKDTLKDATLSIVFPQGFTVQQSTEGAIQNPTTVSATLGTLAPGQAGSVFLEAVVGPNTAVGAALVTSATLAYALPSGVHDSAVGYVINHASAENAIAGFALGTGFFPTTLFGWLVTIIVILTIILIARRIAKQKEAAKHGHGGHGDAHH